MKYGKYKWKFIYAVIQVRVSLGLFSRNSLSFRTFFKDILFRISWEKDRRCSLVSNSRTNGQMYIRTYTSHKTSRKSN